MNAIRNISQTLYSITKSVQSKTKRHLQFSKIHILNVKLRFFQFNFNSFNVLCESSISTKTYSEWNEKNILSPYRDYLGKEISKLDHHNIVYFLTNYYIQYSAEKKTFFYLDYHSSELSLISRKKYKSFAILTTTLIE